MNELFRFIEQSYAPIRRPDDFIRIGSDDTDFQRRLRDARNTDDPREALKNAAATLLDSDRFVDDPSKLNFGPQYEDCAGRLAGNVKERRGIRSAAEVVTSVFDMSAADVLANDGFVSDRLRVDDSLLALKLAGERSGAGGGDLSRIRRVMRFVELADEGEGAMSAEELAAFLRRPFLVDDRLLPPAPAAPSGPEEPPPQRSGDEQRIRAIVERVAALQQTWETLMSLRAEEMELQRDPRDADQPREAELRQGTPRRPGHQSAESAFVIRRDVTARFSEQVRSTLSWLNVEPDTMSLPRVVEKVKTGLMQASEELRPHLIEPPTRVYRVGAELFALKPAPLAVPAAPPAPQFANATFKPFLVGNLQVVKQELIGYEPGEVSHIENVLPGETFKRETERQEVTEITTTTEKEVIKSEERDLQSTERSEMRQEAQASVGETMSETAGQKTTTSYGSLVENRESGFGKEVTDRAVNRISERIRELRVRREQKTFIERASHQFNNENTENVLGIYQWVDKKFKTRVFNYGQRLLYDVVVPEPAAFFIDSLQKAQHGESFNLVKPEPPRTLKQGGSGIGALVVFGYDDLHPTDLHAGNYLDFARTYGATGSVEPPPPDFQTTIAWPSSGTGNPVFKAEKINIPPGYTAVTGFYQSTNWHGEDGGTYNGAAEVNVGSGYHRSLNFLSDSWKMNNESGEVAITFNAGGIKGHNVAVGVVCKNDTAYQKWQIKTYTAIMEGYKRQLAVYEERLAAMQSAMRTQMLLTKNYAHDPSIERTELKKAFVHLLMSQHWGKVSVATPDPIGLPKNLAQTKSWGAVVAFFERAIEWENMLYYYYPYFWARPHRWPELLLIQDLNPQFEAFLKAGAARVVAPIRPGFEAAMAHFQETGEVWFGKDIPEMFSEMNVSILEEILTRNLQPGEEKCVQEWEVKLPTTLVMLRSDGKLPEWKSDIPCGGEA